MQGGRSTGGWWGPEQTEVVQEIRGVDGGEFPAKHFVQKGGINGTFLSRTGNTETLSHGNDWAAATGHIHSNSITTNTQNGQKFRTFEGMFQK